MKLIVRRNGQQPKELEGSEARAALKKMLTDIGNSIMLPEPPFTGIIRRRALDRLRAGDPIWNKQDGVGQVAGDATVIRMPQKIVGILKEDGTFEEAGGGSE